MAITFNKQDISSFPFDNLYRLMSAASKRAEAEIMDSARRQHNTSIDARIKALYANREESYEGDRDADFPFVGPDKDYVLEAQAEARKAALSQFCASESIIKKPWVLPQLAAYLAKIPLVFTAEGKVDSTAYLKELMKDDFHRGIWALCTHRLRGDIITKQFAPENRNYCALVPLLLMPHKRFNNIKYSQWDPKSLQSLVDPNLYEAMMFDEKFELTVEQTLEARETGLQIRSGPKAGGMRNPQTTHKLYSMPPEFKNMPWLAQVMAFQIWCAHPVNRTDLMILDYMDWDNIPEPMESAPKMFVTDNENNSTPW